MQGLGHEHCDQCYNARCQFPLHVGLSCPIVTCPNSCGCVFHQCKQEEHQLLCTNETVPCLNASYGCPLTMTRSRLAKHLEVCPASVVCCSMEWNRLPATEDNTTFCRNISENPRSSDDLDVAVALRDQELLFNSIKMVNVFPEFALSPVAGNGAIIPRLKRKCGRKRWHDPVSIVVLEISQQGNVEYWKFSLSDYLNKFSTDSHHPEDQLLKTKVHRAVDTADLGVPAEGLPLSDLVTSTLLCCLERESKGHKVSESTAVNGLFMDVGTQTFIFADAPFPDGASLADLLASSGKADSLHMQVQAESVTCTHNRRNSVFSYMCGSFFRRDQCHCHSRNTHDEIQATLDGWSQQRCPLAYLGCTYTQTRMEPAGHPAVLKPNGGNLPFVIQPEVASALTGGQSKDLLSYVPLEVLQRIATYLDSYTLSQLALVSRPMREVCATLLNTRGMVLLEWEKTTHQAQCGSSWVCQKKVSRLEAAGAFQ